MKIKRSKHDDVFSKLVRLRNNNICEHCESNDPEKMQCAHILTRSYITLRWHPMNAFCLCASCHAKFTGKPWDFGKFCDRMLGKGHRDIINEIGNSGRKIYPAEKEDLYKDYQKQLKDMEELRNQGHTERLEFIYPL